MKLGLVIAGLGMAATAALAQQTAPESGLKAGVSTSVFQVVDVSGPNKGKQLCYR